MNRNRIPTIFSIYMLDVICCALGCVILLWQLKHTEAEEQTEAARQAEQAAKLAQEKWKLASTEVDSVTAEIDALRAKLDATQQREQRLSIELARRDKDLEEANRLIALRQKEYDALRQAWILSEAMLKTVRGERDKVKEEQRLTALDLANKVKSNATLLLQLTAADKKVAELEKEASARQIDVQEAAKRLKQQLARLQAMELKNQELEKQTATLRADAKETQA